MDQLDKLIIMDLLQNCRQSYQAIARKNGVTLNAIKKRVQKLLDTDVLEFCIEPDVAMIDGEWVLAFISTSGEENQAEFIATLGNNRMISEVGTLSGSRYIIYAVYSGMEGLSEFNRFLRMQEHVTELEVHQIMFQKGPKVEFSFQDLKILNCLIDDPRKRLSMIAECTGYSAKTVRRVLTELMNNRGVWFGSRLRLNSSDSVTILARIELDEKQVDLSKVLEFLNTDFPEFITPTISASEPVIFAAFFVEDVRDINPVIERVKTAPFIKSVVSIMGSESHSFSDLRRYWLEEKFREAGLHSPPK